MKLIELNIGLASKTLGTLNPNEVLNALTERGFILIKYRLVDSVSRDGKETCLAVKCECPADWQTQLASLSDKLGQDCISLCGFIGHSPYDAFCAELWKSPEAVQLSECQAIQAETLSKLSKLQLSPCQAIQAKHKARAEREEFNGFTRQEFLNYLEFTIIPDSRESGSEGYAEDLETALHFLRNP